jgi:hypothetical protein
MLPALVWRINLLPSKAKDDTTPTNCKYVHSPPNLFMYQTDSQAAEFGGGFFFSYLQGMGLL